MISFRKTTLGLRTVLLFALGVSTHAWSAPGGQVSYEELCSYDRFCQKLKQADGTFIGPKNHFLVLLNQTSAELKEKSRLLGVDPVAVAGSLLAENSMNVQADDAIQNALVASKILPTASVLGKSFSIGLGQINISAAVAVEPLIAKILKRKQRSEEEVAAALLTPSGAFEYAAGIIRDAQDCYKEQGVDISKDPGLLATLYNLGGACDRAAQTKAEKTPPRINYFGYFVRQNEEQIKKALNEKLTNVDYKEPQGREKFQYIKSVQLFKSVPHCDKEGAGDQGTYNEATTFSDAIPAGEAQGYFRVVSRTVDCDMNSWVMIQDQNGKMGWVPNETLLQEASEKEPWFRDVPRFGCPMVSSCLEKIKSIAGKNFVGLDPRSELGLVQVKYLAADGKASPPDPKLYSRMLCNDRFMPPGAGGGGPAGGSYGANPPKDKEPIYVQAIGKTKAKMLSKIRRLRDEISRAYGEETLKSYRRLFDDLERAFKSCSSKCFFNRKEWEQILNFDPGDGSVEGLLKLGMLNQIKAPKFYDSAEGPRKKRSSDSDDDGFNMLTGKTVQDFELTLKTTCTLAAWKNESLQEVVKRLVDHVSKLPKTSSILNHSQVLGIEYVCAKVAQLKDPGLDPPHGSRDIKPDQDASVFIKQPCRGKGAKSNCFNVDELDAKLIDPALRKSNPEQIDNFLLEVLQTYSSMTGIGSSNGGLGPAGDDKNCGYDPFKNDVFVQKMLDSKCAERVLTNDKFLVGKYRNSKDVPVMEYESADSTQFAIQVKTQCEESESSRWTRPGRATE